MNMVTSSRFKEWVLLVIIGVASSAPLDEQRIYFPGENPDDLESRSYGLQPNLLPDQSQQLGQDVRQAMPWSQDGIHEIPSGGEIQQTLPVHTYGDQSSYSSDYSRQVQGAMQHQPAEWETGPQFAGVGREPLPGNLLYGSPTRTSFHQSSQSEGAAGYLGNRPLHHGTMYSGATNSGHGMIHGGKKATKHTWTSHYSTSGTGQSHINPQHVMNLQQPNHDSKISLDHTQLGHTFSSSAHKTSSQDLASILDGPSHQSHELHPNIKQAFDNVIRDYGSGAQPHHTKETTVQNVGREPSHIQSTSSNDDISLSELIEQLQMLEQSPRHVNITWCEEKIKEFLQALRRKQASGVFINQQVQEETLHQVLTQESVESTDSSGAVHEPLFTKVTVRPLGREDMTQSQGVSDFIKHEKEQQGKGEDVEVSAEPSNPPQEEQPNHAEPEIITVTPHEVPQKPEIMSHQHEQPKETPPFTSDNSNDLKELELELPEYVPFEHAHSGDVEEFQSNIQRETRPIPHHLHEEPGQVHSEISIGHEISDQHQDSSNHVLGGYQVSHEVSAEHHSSGDFEQPHPDISTGHEISDQHQDSSNHVLGGYQTSHHDVSSDYHHGQQETQNLIGQSSSTEEKKEELLANQPHDGLTHQGGNEVSHEFMQTVDESHHTVHGRPEAPKAHSSDTQESNQEEKAIYAVHSEQTSHSEENSPDVQLDGSQKVMTNMSKDIHNMETHTSSNGNIQNLHKQQINYDTLIEELIQLESIPGHQAIDKCEEKIQEFLEILKYQQEQGFGRNQQELERLHQTLIAQAQERSTQLANAEETTLPPTSFWRRVQKKVKSTYESAKDRAKDVIG